MNECKLPQPKVLGDRRCISCGKLAPKSEFWRVVRDISGQVTLDRGMGRSAYICPNYECLQKAQKKQRLNKALKTAVPESIFQELATRLAKVSSS